MFGKSFDFNPFPVSEFVLAPLQTINTFRSARIPSIGTGTAFVHWNRLPDDSTSAGNSNVFGDFQCAIIKSLVAYQLSINTVENKRGL